MTQPVPDTATEPVDASGDMIGLDVQAARTSAGANMSLLSLDWTEKGTGAAQQVIFDVVTNETHEAIMAITEHPVETGSDVVDNARPKPKKVSIEGYVSSKPFMSNLNGNQMLQQRAAEILMETPPRNRPATMPLDIPTPPLRQGYMGGFDASVGGGVGAGLGGFGGGVSASAGFGISDFFSALFSSISGGSATPTTATLAPDNPTPPGSMQATLQQAQADFPDRIGDVHGMLLAAQIARARITITSRVGQIANMVIERVGVPRTPEVGNGLIFQVDLLQIRIVHSETADVPVPAQARSAKQQNAGPQGTSKPTHPPKSLPTLPSQQPPKSSIGGTFVDYANGNYNPAPATQ